jgi:phage host-nuclease inhibitor protein Gam
MTDYEKLGAFYLGRNYDLGERRLRDELLLYDSKDLTTHAVCVGMTGSGKTGLCLALLEEAAIDSVPAIIIDPKGDLANLALAFPDLDAASFLPWVDASEAARHGMTVEQYAADTAKRWKQGLADWGQPPERIARFRDAAEVAIYTPGSDAGRRLTVLRSFDAPPDELIQDSDAYREHLTATASGLLALLGIDADPVRSREHILLASLLDHAWRNGRNLDVAALIHEIQNPPIQRVGVLDLETFYPERERVDLAMSLNNLLASPSFAGWMEGEPLDIRRLLHTEEGKPRLSILSIAHLSDAERMFFVTILLNAMVAWMRGQPGTSSLRALLYMDEVFGYFPPTAKPPSKPPMLTLLKQARAFGLGVVLATQNPVDLDYRGLSNIGTWFLGRLQTERDKARVLEGLEGAAVQSGTAFDRKKMDATLAALGKRVFLMNNVHEDEPVIFQTRWVLSYLRGPLTRQQIKQLTKAAGVEPEEPPAAAAAIDPLPKEQLAAAAPEVSRPAVPASVDECFAVSRTATPEGSARTYRAALHARVRLHFSRSTYKIDSWETLEFFARLVPDQKGSPWEQATQIRCDSLQTQDEPESEVPFAAWPPELTRSTTFTSWKARLKEFCYRSRAVTIWRCENPKAYSQLGESEGEFRTRLALLARETRDLEVEKLRKRYASKIATLKDRIRSAEERVQREDSQYGKAKMDSVISFGSTVLNALFGRKLASATNVRRASTTMKGVGSAAQQRRDVQLAEQKLADYQRQLDEMEQQLKEDLSELEQSYRAENLELEPLSLKPLKTDIQVDAVQLVWTPWDVTADGIAERAFALDPATSEVTQGE